MYENLYYYSETIDKNYFSIHLKPNFREEIALFDEEKEFLSDGEIRMGRERRQNGPFGEMRFQDVYVSEDAQWALEIRENWYDLYVTERTQEIETSLGSYFNNEFNRLLARCKNQYYLNKKKEVRLYFYDSKADRLRVCNSDTSCYFNEKTKYQLNRILPTTVYCNIDKRYSKPEQDCFILGRIRKTIGLKNSKLLDFIEPVHQIPLDFEKDEILDFGDDFSRLQLYQQFIYDLSQILYDLLEFSILKEHDSLKVMRIRSYLQNYSAEDKNIISLFNTEISEAFKEGDTQKLRQLNDVLCKAQDCTNVKFELRLEEEVKECGRDRCFEVYFSNGEYNYLPAMWVYENIHNCTDANGIYLGELRDRYNFF